MTIPVRIDLSGELEPIASTPACNDLARELEQQIGEIAATFGITDTVAVELTAGRDDRPLRVQVHRRSVPFPPDLLSRLAVDPQSSVSAGESVFGPTVAGACVAAYAADEDCSADELRNLILDMIRDRPSVLVRSRQATAFIGEHATATETTATAEVLRELLDLGVIPRAEAVVSAVRQNLGNVEEAIETAFASLQGRRIEICLAPKYREALTGTGDPTPQAVGDSELHSTADSYFQGLEERLVVEWAIVPPDMVWTTDRELEEGLIAMRVNDRRSWPFRGLATNELLLLDAGDGTASNGSTVKREIPNPANPWLTLVIIEAAAESQLRRDALTAPPAAFAALVVYRELLANAHCLLGTEQTLYLLQDLQSRSPELVRIVLRHFTLTEITRLLRDLLRERIPPRLFPVMLECLARTIVEPVDPAARLEVVRKGLSDYLEHRFDRSDQRRTFFELPQELVERGSRCADAYEAHVRDAVWSTLGVSGVVPLRAAILAPDGFREQLLRVLRPELPDVAVLQRSDFGEELPEIEDTIRVPEPAAVGAARGADG